MLVLLGKIPLVGDASDQAGSDILNRLEAGFGPKITSGTTYRNKISGSLMFWRGAWRLPLSDLIGKTAQLSKPR